MRTTWLLALAAIFFLQGFPLNGATTTGPQRHDWAPPPDYSTERDVSTCDEVQPARGEALAAALSTHAMRTDVTRIEPMWSAPMYQQSVTVNGSVRDAKSGRPLPGANVLLIPEGLIEESGRRHGMAADRSGHFSFSNVEAGTYTLRISFVGYRTFEETLPVGTQNIERRIVLQPVSMPGPEIEISAMKARERFSPVTFSDVTREDIENEYFVQDIPVMLSDMPSVTYYSESGHGIGYNYLRIRGFDQRRLAVMINGIPQNDPEDHNVYWINLVDQLGNTEEIQVQRGAGSAFYGPPAIGGSINIVTGDFSNRRGITISTGAGSYNTQRFAFAAGSGLIEDTYTFYGRLSRLRTDGYRDHSYTEANSYYFAATRYDEKLTTRINVYGGPVQDGLVYYGLPKFAVKDRTERRKNYNYWSAEDGVYTYTSERRPQEHEQFNQPHFELLNEWKAGERLTFNSAVFYVVGQGYFDFDGTGWTDAAYYRLTPEYGFTDAEDPRNPIIRAWVDNRQVGWLPRLTYDHGGGSLTAGLELRRHRSEHWGRIQWAENLPEGIDPDRHYYEYHGAKDIAAVYVQEQYRLSPRINLMGNVQYVFNRYSLFDEKFVGTDFSVDYHFINPRIGINYNVSEAVNFYGNVSYTHREPRLKNLYDAGESSGGAEPQFETLQNGTPDFSRPLVRPEQLLNVEFGAGWSSEKARVLLNAYVMDFTDEIIKSGGLDRFGQPITGNAEQTLHTGLELSARWSPFRSVRLDVNGMLSRSRLQKYMVYSRDAEGNTVATDLSGNRIAGFPEQLANIKFTWQRSGFTGILTWKFVGAQYTDNTEREDYMVEPYNVLNASLGYRLPPILGLRSLDMRFNVNNIFDRLYAQAGEGDQFFVGAERNFFFDIVFGI
ncbi:MAG: TonB-dependent receptor [Bacteroidetes bacterium]|nr:TonB-dependent receptor [Bacteroidota bacterium]